MEIDPRDEWEREHETSSGSASPEPVEDDHAPVVEPSPRMYHIKIPYDANLAWADYIKKIFLPDPYKCLVMAENLNKATGHVHMQGFTVRTERALKKIREDMHHDHALYKEFQRKRAADPITMANKRLKLSTVSKRAPDDVGFQYVCKEKNVPLYNQGFSKEELAELHEKSNVHVQGKKQKIQEVYNNIMKENGLTQDLAGCDNERNIEKFMDLIRYLVCEYYRKAGQKLPMSRYFGDDMINAIYSDKNCPATFRRYLAKKLAKH